MIPIMPRSRVIGLGSLIVGAIALANLVAGCSAKAHSGDTCLKDFDCESNRCVQSTCVYAGASPIDPGDAATDATDAADAAADTAKTDTAMD
jgi:hypothetical protein